MAIRDSYFVSSIPASMSYDYVINKHYAHRKPQIKYAFGLFRKENKELCGVCTFGKPLSSTLINKSMGGGHIQRCFMNSIGFAWMKGWKGMY